MFSIKMGLRLVIIRKTLGPEIGNILNSKKPAHNTGFVVCENDDYGREL